MWISIFFTFFFNQMYFCDAKAEFFVSLLQSSQSHNSSEIILICWFGAEESCAA